MGDGNCTHYFLIFVSAWLLSRTGFIPSVSESAVISHIRQDIGHTNFVLMGKVKAVGANQGPGMANF